MDMFIKRVKLILQSEDSECGQACLAMIFNYYGYGISLPELRKNHSAQTGGTKVSYLMETCNDHGFRAIAYSLTIEELRKLTLPCILHWNFSHFVVLTKINKNSVEINDPALGCMRIDQDKLKQYFTGVAVEIKKSESFSPVKPKKINIRDVTGKVIGFIPFIFKMLAASILIDIIALLMPRISQLILDKVIPDHDKNLLIFCFLVSLALLVLQFVISTMSDLTKIKFEAYFKSNWRSNVFSKLTRLPVDFFKSRG
ncbi:hypothetical protein E2W74_24750, partial [Salmonella enterica]|nr:hypothetical protein [Salmonella enterica]ECC2600416.1 hypothetical protein [Salmonella enterica subsp. enterica serovar Infantis]EIN5223738.1 hypothetical protein [Salmonella enterica subsp. enterica]EAT7816659.1 hypothetical protein [Salmonella enterica]EAW4028698.1 hypothetical protein [Salmonella enterica]